MRKYIGEFFFMVGLILLGVFISTDLARFPVYGFFCSGASLIVLGLYIIWRAYVPPPPSARFRLLRKNKTPPPPKAEKKP